MSAFPLMLARIILDQIVHLLKGATHSLGHEEKGPNTREHTECSEEYICAVARALNQGGVMRPMMKLLSQLEQIEMATPLARKEDGKISGMRLAMHRGG